ncbi:hypothetical protein HU200_023374 [Digitaria exilis]|uniref:Uncharacterized protein n=1 Tax=Digitaria exilis TaxID=1010633 RepID=A0A835C2Y9_9POAL|nr:hypothetical protein HU200_023374 [Digitaria exilis]
MPFYISIIILMSWAIWMVRNDLILRGIQPSIQGCKDHFKREFALASLRAKRDYPDLMSTCIDMM